MQVPQNTQNQSPNTSNVEAILRNINTVLGRIAGDIVASTAELTTINTTLSTAFPAPLSGSATWDPSSLTTLTQASTTITVSGAALGNRVMVSFSLDLQGQTLTAYCSAANTVTVVLFNSTSGTLNLSSGTLQVRIYQ